MIGSDPELFFHNGKKFVSAIGKIGGSKAEPLRLLSGFALQEDNVAVEFNIPPTKNAEQWLWSHQLMMQEIAYRGEAFGLTPRAISSANFDEEELANPAAQVFGCDPDFNAWELEPNPAPNSPDKSLRSAGGHIHFGMEGGSRLKIQAVRLADLLMGIPLAFLDRESKRRELYGRAGACRIKPYGVEYRTPSNVWLRDDMTTFTVAEIALRLCSKEFVEMNMEYVNKNEGLIQKAINELDEEAFMKLRPKFQSFWPKTILNKIKITKKIEPSDDEAIQVIIEE